MAVLIPVKSFRAAKGRLSPVIAQDARSTLARSLAEIVVAAAAPLPVAVVCADAEVAAWAADLGALVIADPGGGLNAAVTEGVRVLRSIGVETAVIAHGDLPEATSLGWVAEFRGITLIPDRHGDGTNVIAIPTGSGFVFAYGPGSFGRHVAEAHRCKLPTRVVHDAALGVDVDTPSDLLDAGGTLRSMLLHLDVEPSSPDAHGSS